MDSKLFPFAGRHAVQSAICALTFAGELDTSKFEGGITKAQEALKSVLPVMEPLQTVTLQFGPGLTGAPNSPRIGGWQFSLPGAQVDVRQDEIPVRRMVTLQSNRLIVVENDYNRWANFKSLTNTVLREILAVSDDRPLVDVALAYNDVFIWKDVPEKAGAATVFSPDSPLLTPNVFSVGTRYFHSNHGFISDDLPDGADSLVENVNVARTPESSSTFDRFVVTTEHRLVSKQPIYGATNIQEFVMPALEHLHRRNKMMLGSLLVPEVKEMIKLGV
ncbi:TIGR04255 family protein [uncultured Xanthomonas sp.]|uniref:TIGR04255 family protein n=1 Tax=uncultured Xanthomonas sp. TaxID=152831 RepID=UPI0025E56E81|nr:TIGR04255 family protein [uncultured Xanthomonas sp.]